MKLQQMWWKENFAELITSLHIHSDNAAQHFKCNKTLYFLSLLPALLGWIVSWSFGCPGHGKGPWDGFGAVLKRICRRDAVDQQVELKSHADVAQHLRLRFESADWQEKHGLDSRYTINRVVIHQAGLGDIERPVVEEEYEAVAGIRRSFGYRALRDGIVLQRWYDCWCAVCMSVTQPGHGSMDSNYRVVDCCSEKRWRCSAGVTAALTAANPFRWWECDVQRKDTRGVRARRDEAQANGRKLAPKLKAGSVVAVQDRLNQSTSYPYQLGVVVDAGGGSCVVTEVDSRRTINGTCFDKGDFAISVKW
jgi:hypothetical protein